MLFNTGEGLTPGQTDANWQIVSGPGITTPLTPFAMTPNAAWAANQGSLSTWIGPSSSGTATFLRGAYVYQTTFTLAGYSQATSAPELNFRFVTDNYVTSIVLNSTSIYTFTPNPAGPASVNNQFNNFRTGSTTNAAAFQNGINTIQVTVQNGDFPSNSDNSGPTGLQMQLDGTYQPVPAPPAAISLGIGGLVGILANGVRTRRTKKTKK